MSEVSLFGMFLLVRWLVRRRDKTIDFSFLVLFFFGEGGRAARGTKLDTLLKII